MPLTRSKGLYKSSSLQPLIKSEPYSFSTDNIPTFPLRKKRAYLLTKSRPIIKSESPDETRYTSVKKSSSTVNLGETKSIISWFDCRYFILLETNSDQFYRHHALAYLYERISHALLRFRYVSLDALCSVNGISFKVSQTHSAHQATPSSNLPSSAHSSFDCIQCALEVIHRRFCPLCNPHISNSPSTQTQALSL